MMFECGCDVDATPSVTTYKLRKMWLCENEIRIRVNEERIQLHIITWCKLIRYYKCALGQAQEYKDCVSKTA